MRPLRAYFIALALVGAITFVACKSTEKSVWRAPAPSGGSPATSASPQPTETAHADGVRRITVAELQDLVAKGEAVVIDVRNEPAYNQGHIRGAKLIPFSEVVNRVGEFPRDKLIVTYCS
ncbi:MAG: rhodanese-like domain-containing protein [Pyrinomonadaceae bacterium]